VIRLDRKASTFKENSKMESEQAVFANMSIEELQAFKEMYKSNEAIVRIMDGYIEGKVKEEAQAKVKVDFTITIADMISTLVHPDGIHNVYLAWREVEEAQGEPEIIGVNEAGAPNGQAVSKANKEAILALKLEANTTILFNEKHYQVKQAYAKVWKWIPELNKGFQVGKETTTTTTRTTNKRAITVSKREGSQLVLVGHFPTASKAVEYLHLPLGGDSATRVIQREGMFIEPYTGIDYTLA